jgi:hypothetical protein
MLSVRASCSRSDAPLRLPSVHSHGGGDCLQGNIRDIYRECLPTICKHGVLSANNELKQPRRKTRRSHPFCPPDDFIFANEVEGFLDTDNYRKRVLNKLARDLNLPKLTFQVIRRTIATLAQKKGTVKDVQGVLRHSRTATTIDVYMQEIPESVQATVNSIHSELRAEVGISSSASMDSRAPRSGVIKVERKNSCKENLCRRVEERGKRTHLNIRFGKRI